MTALALAPVPAPPAPVRASALRPADAAALAALFAVPGHRDHVHWLAAGDVARYCGHRHDRAGVVLRGADGAVTGGCLLRLHAPGGLAEGLLPAERHRARELARLVDPGRPAVQIEHLHVAPASGADALDALVGAGVAWAAGRGAHHAFHLAWQRPGGGHAPAVPALRAHGLVPRLVIPDYWSAHRARHRLPCPACGPRCGCGALVCAGRVEAWPLAA